MVRYKPLAHQLPQDHKHFGGSSVPFLNTVRRSIYVELLNWELKSGLGLGEHQVSGDAYRGGVGPLCARWIDEAPVASRASLRDAPLRSSQRCVHGPHRDGARGRTPSAGAGGPRGRAPVSADAGETGSGHARRRPRAVHPDACPPAQGLSHTDSPGIPQALDAGNRIPASRSVLPCGNEYLGLFQGGPLRLVCGPRCLQHVRSGDGVAALRSVHGDPIDQELSLYDVANEIAQTYHGMMIAIPEDARCICSHMCPAEMVATLRTFAQKVRLDAYRKSLRGPKKPRPTCKNTTKVPHVSTAK